MSLAVGDLGVLGKLAEALGIFEDGSPNEDWFASPDRYLKDMLANPAQRNALIEFVDEVLGGADRSTQAGVVWLPVVSLDEPPLTVAVTIEETASDNLHIGIGLELRTTGPVSKTTLSIPLFRAQQRGGDPVTQPLLLGSVGGRIRIGTAITLDANPPQAGEARLGGIGLDIDVPTAAGDADPVFGLSLTGLQLPGAQSPRDVRVAADGVDELDDALLDLVLSLVKAQADAQPADSPIAALGGLLGLRSADDVLDFPITELPTRGVQAIADWVLGILQDTNARTDWLGHLATLLDADLDGDEVVFELGDPGLEAELRLSLLVDTGPTGHTQLTPRLAVTFGDLGARLEAAASLLRADLVSGEVFGLPALGAWFALGHAGNRVLDVAAPTVARADRLRLGFALDAARRVNFVLAADNVLLGTHSYPTLDLSSPDALMDAAGNAVGDIAEQLLAGLGDASTLVRQLLGVTPPAGVPALSLATLMTDPVGAVGGYWRQLLATPAVATQVLGALRAALADASESFTAVPGSGTRADPWRLVLIDPLALEVVVEGAVVTLSAAASTSVDTLGQHCTVVGTRLAATLARLDLAAMTAQLLPGAEASISARERGVSPPRARLVLPQGVEMHSDPVGLALGWSPATGLAVSVQAPNPRLVAGSLTLPVALPVIGADGSVTLPPAGWDAVQVLVGHLAGLAGGFLADLVDAVGWSAQAAQAGGESEDRAVLRLADLVVDPKAALAGWLPRLLMSDVAPRALALVADLFGGQGPSLGFLRGSGHPDDPFRLALAPTLPNVAVWFPPAGPEPFLVAAPEVLRDWRPGVPGLPADVLEAALWAEAGVAEDVLHLVDGRRIADGLGALALRWVGGDGRIVPPPVTPTGITIKRIGLAAAQLWPRLEATGLTGLIGREVATRVHVAIGAGAWPAAPAARRLDLTTPGLEAAMFTLPAAAAGDWFVALGTRADCKPAGSSSDGTPEQAARLGRWLGVLGDAGHDIALVALHGAGHAARVAAHEHDGVSALVLLGTPLSEISLTALDTQPAADALRLLQRLLPAPDPAEPDDTDLALGRALVAALMELADRADPGADLRLPVVPAPAPRVGLQVVAQFGVTTAAQVQAALTAITASGLATRAVARALRPAVPLDAPSGVRAGLRWVLPASTAGTLDVRGAGELSLFAYDLGGAPRSDRVLRVRLRVGDRLGWLALTPTLALRAVSADLTLPLDGTSTGQARLTLHDAQVFGQSWERLELGSVPGLAGVQPVLPEARVLLSAALQRLAADVTGGLSVAAADLLGALGLVAPAGGVAADAFDQLMHDPGGLVRQRLALLGSELSDAVVALLGARGVGIDLVARTLRLQGGDAAAGRFGWSADITASATGLAGTLTIGPDAALPVVGGLQLRVTLAPLAATLHWNHPGGGSDVAPIWPAPQAQPLARMLAQAAPGLAAQGALELLRRADATARPLIDALLDALGLLAGAVGDAERALRPMAGLLRDPAGWLRSPGSLASSPLKIQALLDALRPLMDRPGDPGTPLTLASGVSLAVASEGAGARLTLSVDPSGWAPPAVAGRLAGGIGASLVIAPSGPPLPALALHVGVAGQPPGRQAVHALIGAGGLQLFLRPAAGADIPLVPFAGLGSLAAAAQAALPFLLDALADTGDPVGPIVQSVGDALRLRSGTPARFDAAALQAWASNPVGQLQSAATSMLGTALSTLATHLRDALPDDVSLVAAGPQLTLTVGGFSLGWATNTGAVTLAAEALEVPGIELLSFSVTVSPAGLDGLTVTAGPALINAGGVDLKPFVTIAAGLAPAGGARVVIGMAADDERRFAMRWLLAPSVQFDLIASDGPLAGALDTTDPVQTALRIVEVIADLVAAVAMAQEPVQDLLDQPIAETSTRVRDLLKGVLLENTADPQALDTNLFDPTRIAERVQRLISNICGAGLSFTIDDLLTLAFTEFESENSLGIEVGLVSRFPLITGDVMLWLEDDNSWISPSSGEGGLFVGFLRADAFVFEPKLIVNGLGLRIGRNSGPLLDAGLTIESVALHAFAALGLGGASSGGAQLQFANLAVATGGAGGNNGIAQGLMRDTGPTPPQPAFSPALAIQKHGNAPVAVTLRAGDPPGPWWIAIQQGFGPLYLEQVGFDAPVSGGKIQSVSLLMDGSVSLFGLTCAVDDLQITYFTGDGDFLDAQNWKIDLRGLAVSADMAGVSLAGGLLKQVSNAGTQQESVEYLGMLLGRFAVYGLTVYGGYGEGVDAGGQKFTAFFAIGAVNGPIGGPPAFFLTGIGGGFGINRRLVVPTELANFGDYPLIQALDIAATPSDPMAQLRSLGAYFPMQKGMFWFAAGLSFNSFALVDGIAVVGVQIGDGLDINLLGLARMALPRPQVALVSIEVALLVRFSSSEGVLWVQGQLTDNSWLLYPDIKLTGGFAYVIWFKGERAGEFVFTLGGYHPDFSRPGYPVVPRLGLRWSIGSNIVIKAGSYFALTSEALMAGGDFEGSASFGPAWAEVKFGAHGIVYFDPFYYNVSAYARIAAGVTIDTWIFGEITISISLGARIMVEGPDFRGSVTFEVGPIELTFDFGGSDKAERVPIGADEFIAKYLEAADGGGALAHALMTNTGALPSKGEDATPDGSSSRPFVVVVEFSMTFTSTVPAQRVQQVSSGFSTVTEHPPSKALAVGPMGEGTVEPMITLTWIRAGTIQPFPFIVSARPFGRFPVGVWGPAGDPNNRKVPKAEMVEALSELDLLCTATASGGGPEIPYYQVEIGPRKPLPFSRRPVDVNAIRTTAQSIAGLVGTPATVDAAFGTASRFLTRAASPTTLAALRGERQAPPRPGTLAEGLETATKTVVPKVGKAPPGKVYDHVVDAPVAVGLFAAGTNDVRVGSKARTTVKDSARAWRIAPPTLASVTAQRSRSIAARLVLADAAAVESKRTRTGAASLIGAAEVPPTALAQAPTVVVARTGAPLATALAAFDTALASSKKGRAAAGTGALLGAGQTVVLKLPNAKADASLQTPRPSLGVAGAPARIVLIGAGGQRLADARVGPNEPARSLVIPRGTERIVAIGLGGEAAAAARRGDRAGLSGWHAGLSMPYVGWASAVAPGCVLRSSTDQLRLHRERVEAGWVTGAELARGVTTVTTTFADAPRTVLIVLDDPAVTGADIGGRQLLLGLDGAMRAAGPDGAERAPQLLALDNRSVLAYDIVPGGDKPVSVTIASQQGWSLVGVLGSETLDAQGALALVAARGLDAALRPLAPRDMSITGTPPASRLLWNGAVRSVAQRRTAQARAQGVAAPVAPRALKA